MLKYNREQHKEYLNMSHQIGLNWLQVFEGNTEFYSAAYWDLFTEIWKSDGPVRKTDATKFLKGVKSPLTAGKYVEISIESGLLCEEDNPKDARSKLLKLSPEIEERLDVFFDSTISELRKTNHQIAVKGPSPEEP